MKILSIVCISVLSFFINISVQAQQWAFVGGGTGFTSSGVNSTDLDFDGSNTLYIAYPNSSSRATVMKYASNVWTLVGTEGFSAGVVSSLQMRINKSNGDIYVSYRDLANGSRATVMRYNGSSWVNVGPAGFTATSASEPCLALDNNGAPYVAYSDGNFRAVVVKFNGSSWVNVGGPASDGSTFNIGFDLDGNNIPYVAYTDATAGNKTTLRKFDGANWVTVGYKGISTGVATVNVVAIDKNNIPYVAFGDYSYDAEAVVKKFANNSWSTVGTEGFTYGEMLYPNLDFDNSNTPYLACSDEGYTSRVLVYKFTGSAWSIVGNPNFSATYARQVSFGIDGNNTPYAAYQDLSASNKATAMKYSSAPTLTTGNISGSTFCPGASVNVPFTTSGPFTSGNVFTAQLSDDDGNFGAPTNIGTLTATSSGTIAAVLTYTATASTNYRIRVVASNPSVAGTPYLSNIFITDPTNSTTKTFNGSGDWNNPSKWSPCGVPTPTTEVTIGSGDSVIVPAGYTATVKRVNNSAGGKIIIKTTGKLIITGAPAGGRISSTVQNASAITTASPGRRRQ